MNIHKINGELLHTSEPFDGDSTEYTTSVAMADYADSPYNVNGEYYIYCVGLFTYGRNYVEEWVDEAPHLFLTYEEAYDYFNQLCVVFGTTEETE